MSSSYAMAGARPGQKKTSAHSPARLGGRPLTRAPHSTAPGRLRGNRDSGPCKRLAGLHGRDPLEQTGNADVFIRARPVNSLAITKKFPAASICLRSMKQPGKPHQRDRNRPPIDEVDDQLVIRDPNTLSKPLELTHRRTHATPPETVHDSRSPSRSIMRGWCSEKCFA